MNESAIRRPGTSLSGIKLPTFTCIENSNKLASGFRTTSGPGEVSMLGQARGLSGEGRLFREVVTTRSPWPIDQSQPGATLHGYLAHTKALPLARRGQDTSRLSGRSTKVNPGRMQGQRCRYPRGQLLVVTLRNTYFSSLLLGSNGVLLTLR